MSSLGVTQTKRSPGVKFDDLPGHLPEGSIPEDADYEKQATIALAQLNELNTEHFTPGAIWRDLLAFTHTFRVLYSNDRVCGTLRELCSRRKATRFERTASAPRFSGFNWIDVDFTFSMAQGDLTARAAGIVSCLRCPDGVWRIWMLRTWLESFDGHGDPDHARPSTPVDESGHSTDKPLGAIVIGAGQSGLSTAGRLQALGVSYLVFEKNPRVGDVWRNRYGSLRIHTPKEYGMLALGDRYPASEPEMMTARRMGDCHQVWAESHHLNIRTSTPVTSARYDKTSQVWTVTAATEGQPEQTFTARNLVVSIGPGFAQPAFPSWATPEAVKASGFKGDVLHGSEWSNAERWAGKNGIVVGTANTGHDVAEDMANAGMDTTMLQRGRTFVLPVEWMHAGLKRDYHADKPTEVADRETDTYPIKISREMTNKVIHGLVDANAERFDALERAGFQLDRKGDLAACLYERFGGHYIDHGCSARIAKGEIKVESTPVKGLTADGIEFENGTKIPADLIVAATGFNSDFRADVAKIIGSESAAMVDEYGGMNAEGEMRGFARYAGHPNLYYHGHETRTARWFSRFVSLAIQAEELGQPLEPYNS